MRTPHGLPHTVYVRQGTTMSPVHGTPRGWRIKLATTEKGFRKPIDVIDCYRQPSDEELVQRLTARGAKEVILL